MSSDDPTAGRDGTAAPRQAIVKQPGRVRRAKLMPAPNTDPHPETPIEREEGGVAPAAKGGASTRGENDDRLRQDRPPHW